MKKKYNGSIRRTEAVKADDIATISMAMHNEQSLPLLNPYR